MLRRLGIDLARPADDGHQRQVHVDAVVSAELHTELPDGFQKGQRLDIADRAANLDHAHIRAICAQLDASLDLIRNVRNDLYRGAQVVATPLLRDDALVDPPGGEVTVAAGRRAHEALVVTEIQVCFSAVLRDEHFAVLERAHRARIHVDVGVELDHRDLEATGLEDRTERSGGDAFAQRGHDTTSDEYKARHKNFRRISVAKESLETRRIDGRTSYHNSPAAATLPQNAPCAQLGGEP